MNLKTAINGVDSASGNKDEEILKAILKKISCKNPTHWHNVVKDWKGVSEETTTGGAPAYQMLSEKKLLVPAIQCE